MTETPDPSESPEIEQVRRLLAEARHSEPMPEDVAARMDDVLAGLRAEPGTASAPEPAPEPSRTVVPFARRRRLRAAGWLVAAAAVVVGGVTLVQHIPESSSSGTASATAESAQERSPKSQPRVHLGNTGNDRSTAGVSPTPPAVVRQGRLVVRPHRFPSDALAGRRLLQRPGTSQPFSSAECAGVPTGDGEALGATYRRAPAVLVYRPPSGDSQVVDLYLCGSRDVVRTTTLPAP